MRVEPILDDDRVFTPGRPVTVTRKDVKACLEIEFSRRQHGRLILKLRGIDSISEVERWVGAELSVSEQELPSVEEGSFYTFHLKGCSVVTAEGESLGTVTDVMDSGGTHILQVDGKDGEILIPFAKPFLRKVELPEGLLDLNK